MGPLIWTSRLEFSSVVLCGKLFTREGKCQERFKKLFSYFPYRVASFHSLTMTNPRTVSRRTAANRAAAALVIAASVPTNVTVAPVAVAPTTAAITQGPPPSPWRTSKAKKLLHDDIISGRTLNYSGPTAVYNSRREFQRYKKSNFTNNYYTLRKAIESRQKGAAAGRAALNHDIGHIVARRNREGYFHYNGSDVETQLRSDVQRGLTNGKKPAQVRNSRRLYQQLELSLFANHLSAERRRHQRRMNSDDYRERMRFVNATIAP